jgi:ADP-ribosylglycohydrolase
LGPDSPVLPLVLKGIIKGSSLSNKEELAGALDQMLQPNPEQQQMAQMQQQAQIALLEAQVAELQGRAQESQANAQESLAKAQKTAVETQLMPEKMRIDVVQAASTNLAEQTTDDFERRLKVANILLKDRELKTKENIVEAQMNKKVQ